MRRMNVLLVGGCGKVGHLVAEPLQALDEETQWYSFDPAPEHECPMLGHIHGDATDLGMLFQAARKSDALVYMPMGDMRDDASLFQVAMYGLYNALIVAEELHKPVVFISSISVASVLTTTNPGLRIGTDTAGAVDDPYCVSKLAAESMGKHFANSFGMSVLVLRLGTPMPDEDVAYSRNHDEDYPNLLAASDLADALHQAVTLKRHTGFDVLNIAGDLTGEHIDLSRTEAVLGWKPTK